MAARQPPGPLHYSITFLLFLSCSLFSWWRRPISGAPATHHEKFSGMESGHELFAWLDSRAKASGENVNGLVDEDDARADLLAFKIPEGELTKEVMVLHGGMFKGLYP